MKAARCTRPVFATLLAAMIMAGIVAGRAHAQTAERGISVAAAAGPTLNDLETGGVDWVFGAGVEWRPGAGPFVVQADARYLTYLLAVRYHYLMPELGAQLEIRAGPLRPFAGGGIGVQYAVRPNDDAWSVTGHVAAGLRVRLSSALAIRLEARARSVDPFGGLTGGLVWKP